MDYQNSEGLTNSVVWNIVTAGTNGVYRELWPNLSQALGNSLEALTNTVYNPNWPNEPDPACTAVLSAFQTETDTGMDWYGQRVRAYLVAPATGPYTFWIASDDTSELFLSSDENPANEQLIACVTSATGAAQYNAQANQQSVPINLVAGRRYYIEALMEQGGGADNLSVQWMLPAGLVESPLPGAYLEVDFVPAIVAQPVSSTVTEETMATFAVPSRPSTCRAFSGSPGAPTWPAPPTER